MHTRNGRLGLVLFAIYLVVYGAFVGVSAFAPERMEAPSIGGVNRAITSGMGLIAFALVLAVIYGVLATPAGDEPSGAKDDEGDAS